uniref:Ionotropic receptor IR2 n=1 Tax=Colaphellus bowringi TaxID=561076 RepID=A0A0S3J2Z8_9CUCU|nr:ionotropic receptor IR2 [Colaphellus bowringi]
MVTEFSCDKLGSFEFLKKLITQGIPTRILLIDKDELSYLFPPNCQIFIVNLQCENSTNILKKANSLKLFSFPFRWIIYHHEPINETIFEESFLSLDILVDSDVTLLEENKNKSVSATKIYKRHRNHPLVIEKMGYWTKTAGLRDDREEKIMVRRRKNLQQIPLNTCIVITHNDSLKHLTDKRDKHIDSIAKVNYVLVEHLSDIVNVTLNYSIQNTWGYKNNKSEWSGMIGELTKNEADIGGTPLFFIIDRVDIIDYIAMTTPTRSKFVFREPKLSYVTNVFTLPFDDYVWASTIALVCIISMVLFIILKWEWKKKDLPSEKDSSNVPELKDSLTDVILFSFGAFCQQGAPSIPFSVPGRITTIILFVSLMFLYTSYSANIVALLQSSSTSIQTLEDLLKSRLQVGVDDTVFNRFYFPNASEAVRRAIYLQKVAPPGKKENFMSIEEGVKRMRQGLFAFHMETGPGYKLVGEMFHESEKCGLKEIQYLQVIDPWLAIQKNSSYKELLKIGLRQIQESGLQTREVSLIYTKKPICTSRGSSFISVGLVDCYPAAVVSAGGAILALIVWILELGLYYRPYMWISVKKVFAKSHEKIPGSIEQWPEWPYLK